MPKLYPILILSEKTQAKPKTKFLSAVNQNRARKTQKPRQPIRIEYHSGEKTLTLSARVVDPSRLSAPAEPSRLAVAYLNTWRVYHPPPPSTGSAHTLTTSTSADGRKTS